MIGAKRKGISHRATEPQRTFCASRPYQTSLALWLRVRIIFVFFVPFVFFVLKAI